MSNTKPFAYNNTGTLIPGTIQVGNIAIAVSDVNFIESGLDWYMGADESIGYVICGEHPIVFGIFHKAQHQHHFFL